MKKFSLLLLTICSVFIARTQCNVIADATQLEITCGESVILSHFGSSSGNISFQENFNNGATTGWAFTQQATFSNPCSPGGVDGTPHIWMGDQSGVPRTLETLPLNFGPSVAPAGGTICFDLLFSEQGDASPCEGPDETDEGVYLQYSVDNGANWITINYFDPNGGSDPQLINWNNWCFAIPNGALVNGVKFRWFQDADSGAEYDHWGIDNVEIIVNDPNVIYTWPHDGYTTSLPGNNPNSVSPNTTTTYTVNMETSTGNCTASVTVVVNNPNVVISAGPDLQVCPGQCVDLQATANVINDPGGIKTFSNNQVEDFDASLFGGATVNVNIQDLNMNNVNPGSLQQVCISNLDFSGFGLPPSGVEALSVTLTCPDGTQVVLVPIGGAPAGAGGFFGSPSSYQNVCFVTSGGATLLSVPPANATPITGTFNSNQPLTGVDGCTANGVWSLTVSTNSLSGSGTFDGWSITFDDEVDSYTPDIIWSPTTFMTAGEQNTLSPTVCPTINTTYTITASDTAGCVTVTDQVTVTTDGVCCQLTIDNIQITNSDCTSPNGGGIVISYSGETTGLLFSVDGGASFQTSNTFSGMNPGTYQIHVIDDANCLVTQEVILTAGNPPTITSVNTTDPTCGNNDGNIVINATGGTGSLEYSIDNNISTQASNNFPNLGGGNYQIVVTDDNGCEAIQSVVLASPNSPSISNVTPTNPDCGGTNGSIVVSASGGTAPLTYSIDNGVTSQGTGTFNNLAGGNYQIVVEDANGCTTTQSVSLTTTNIPNIDAGIDQTICAGDSVILIGSGGVTYSWTGGISNATPFSPVTTTTYTVTGTDANGCVNTDEVTINVITIPTANFTSDVATGFPVLNVVFTNLSTNATNYTWDFGNGTTPVNTSSNGNQSSSFSEPGTYTVQLTASSGNCQSIFTIPIIVIGYPPIEINVPNVFTPNGDNSNDEFFIRVTNGATIKVTIFNRWGNQMFEINDFTTKWNGKDASDGVYFFTYNIVGLDGQKLEGHGHVTLLRK